MSDTLRRQWLDLLKTWSVDPVPAGQAFDDVATHYAEPGRSYHTLDHVRDVLETVDRLHAHARHPDAVRLAAWLHDVVYDSRAADNEERSAGYASDLCARLSILAGPLVAALILRTKTHDAGDDPDAQVLLDADLAVLGTKETDYRRYADAIRREYAWVSEPDYRAGRRHVLERLLNRPRIFHFLGHLEQPARRNLAAELATLSSP